MLQGQVTTLSKSCNYENGQPSQGLDHGLECGGNDLNNQQISSRWSFGDGQGAGNGALEAFRSYCASPRPYRERWRDPEQPEGGAGIGMEAAGDESAGAKAAAPHVIMGSRAGRRLTCPRAGGSVSFQACSGRVHLVRRLPA